MFISSSWVLELVLLPVLEGRTLKPSHVILAASEDLRWEKFKVFITVVEAHYGIIVTFEVSRGFFIVEIVHILANEEALPTENTLLLENKHKCMCEILNLLFGQYPPSTIFCQESFNYESSLLTLTYL